MLSISKKISENFWQNNKKFLFAKQKHRSPIGQYFPF